MDELLKLAKSYGIVDTYDCNTGRSTNQSIETKPCQQCFNYLIVIDFEATCWPKSEVKWRQTEIIGKIILLFACRNDQIVLFERTQSFQQFCLI